MRLKRQILQKIATVNVSIEYNLKSLEEVVYNIYELDHVEALKLLLTGDLGFDFDMEYTENYFERGDWFEDNDDQKEMEETYGEEGFQYYIINTKSKSHEFKEMKPFSNGIDYVLTEQRL